MSPITHFLAGWVTANVLEGNSRRERAAIALAGVAPDLDGVGVVADLLTRNSQHPLDWFGEYHHLLGHNLGFGLLVAGLSLLIAKHRLMTAGLCLLSFHVHLLGDLLGSRGPDGYQWPIPYLLPFSSAWQLTWKGQWELNAWPNIVLTLLLLSATFLIAHRRGRSPLEFVSTSGDEAFVSAVRRRFRRRD